MVFVLSDLLHLLKRTGLNEYESKAYAALLELSTATAAEVSKKAAIPRARVYDVLVALEKKGFVSQSPSRPIKFNSFSPEKALSLLEEAKKKSFAAELEELSNLKESLGKHARSIKKANIAQEENFLLLSGRATINSKIRELLEKAKEETVICTNETAAFKKLGLLQKILQDNPETAAIKFYSPSTIDFKQHFSGLGKVEFQRNQKACRFLVVDNAKSLVFLDAVPSESEKAVLVESPHFSRYLKETIR